MFQAGGLASENSIVPSYLPLRITRLSVPQSGLLVDLVCVPPAADQPRAEVSLVYFVGLVV